MNINQTLEKDYQFLAIADESYFHRGILLPKHLFAIKEKVKQGTMKTKAG